MDDKYRSRCFNLILYDDDPSHIFALQNIRSQCSYVAIKHDRDIWTEADQKVNPDHIAGEFKKPHYHIILKFKQARWNTAVAAELNLAPNYIQPCRNFDGSALYLLHIGHPEKYQYSPDDLEGDLVPAVKKLLQGDNEAARVTALLDWIDDQEWIDYRALLRMALQNNLYSDLRRMGALLQRIVDIHNTEVYESKDVPPLSKDPQYNPNL